MRLARTSTLIALTLTAVLTPVAATAAPPVNLGPFAGTVADGETDEHLYRNAPPGTACPEIVVPYVVVLDYAPPTDTLNVTVGSDTAEGENGTAVLELERSLCTSFWVEVGGQDVALHAAYTVEVARLA